MNGNIKCEFCWNNFVNKDTLLEHIATCKFFKRNLILFDNSNKIKDLQILVKRLDTDEDINRVTNEYSKKVKETERRNKKNKDTAKSKVLKISISASVADCTAPTKAIGVHSESINALVAVHGSLVAEVAESSNNTNSASAIERLTTIKNGQTPQMLMNHVNINQPTIMQAPIARRPSVLHRFISKPSPQTNPPASTAVNNSVIRPIISQQYRPQHFVATTPTSYHHHQPHFIQLQPQPQLQQQQQPQLQPQLQQPQHSLKILTPGELNNRVNNNSNNGAALNMVANVLYR